MVLRLLKGLSLKEKNKICLLHKNVSHSLENWNRIKITFTTKKLDGNTFIFILCTTPIAHEVANAQSEAHNN